MTDKPSAILRRATNIVPRAEVAGFAQMMEHKLRENDHKGGWHECEMSYLRTRISQELGELKRELDKARDGKGSEDNILAEAADVANFAMMIATTAESYMDERREDAEALKESGQRAGLAREWMMDLLHRVKGPDHE